MLADLLESEERLELDSEEEEEKEQDPEEEQEEVQEQEKELEQNWMVDWEEQQFGSAVWDSVEIEKELDWNTLLLKYQCLAEGQEGGSGNPD